MTGEMAGRWEAREGGGGFYEGMPVEWMGGIGTLIPPWEVGPSVPWVIFVGMFPTAALWVLWRWRSRWWGWPVAIACVVAMGGLMHWSQEDDKRAARRFRVAVTEDRLRRIAMHLRLARFSNKFAGRATDVETVVTEVQAGPQKWQRNEVNEAGEFIDYWRRPVRIVPGPRVEDVEVVSAGEDGRFGTADDLSSED